MPRHRSRSWIAGTFLLALVAGPAVASLTRPVERPFRFIGVDHPIDLWQDGNDRWAYFGANGFGPSSRMADKARAALLPLGFSEDASQRPWYRFVKSGQEVIVCDHHEFGVNGARGGGRQLVHEGCFPSANYPCVLVKNGPGTHVSPTVFLIKKTLYGW